MMDIKKYISLQYALKIRNVVLNKGDGIMLKSLPIGRDYFKDIIEGDLNKK